MIDIKYLRINTLATHIELKVETTPGNIFTKILIWNKDSFKDYDIAFDVSSYIIGTSNVEILNIPASELGVTEISGMYFLEFETDEVDDVDNTCCDCNSNTTMGIVANLVPYYNCLADKVLNIDIKNCGDEVYNNCGKSNNEDAYYITSLLQTLNMSILSGYFEDSINILNNLEDICDPCHSCVDYGDTDIFCGYGYGVLNNTVTEQGKCCEDIVPIFSGCVDIVDCITGDSYIDGCKNTTLLIGYIGKVVKIDITGDPENPDYRYARIIEVDNCDVCEDANDTDIQSIIASFIEILDTCPEPYSGCFAFIDCITEKQVGPCYSNLSAEDFIGKVLYTLGQGGLPDTYHKVVEIDDCLKCDEMSDNTFNNIIKATTGILDDCPQN